MAYTNEEKSNIVNRINQGEPIRDLCAEYGVSRSTLYRWLSNYDKSVPSSAEKGIPTVKEYNILQRRVEKLENVIAILKTVDCTVYAITISLVGILGNQPRVSSVSCQSYNKRSNWLACLCLGFYVRNEDCQPSSCCGVRFKQVEP